MNTAEFAAVMARRLALAVGATCFAAATQAVAQSPAASCGNVAQAAFPGGTITMAQTVAPGAYQLPRGGVEGANIAGDLTQGTNPEFCRVAATLPPSTDSHIQMEVWMPTQGWNGKFIGMGNFGWAGSQMYAAMLTAIEHGYAVEGNDTGHDSSKPGESGGEFALGHPEKLIDYAYRADHLSTVDAKNFIKAFYQKAPTYSYWIGCSLGGLEGLVELKRYPTDYNGAVIGAPPNPIVLFNAQQLWGSWLIAHDPARAMNLAKLGVLHKAVLEHCGSAQEIADGVLNRPDLCLFDPKQIQCSGADAPDCLSAPQVYLMEQVYTGPKDPKTGKLWFPGPAKGSELQLTPFVGAKPMSVAADMFRYVAFGNRNWDPATMDWHKDVIAALNKAGPLMDVDARLKPFFDAGGKVVFYIGWNDGHNPVQLAGYYDDMLREGGADAARNSRLFAIPGMGHCGGGEGCDSFNKIDLIDDWVASGKAPEQFIAARIEDGKVVRTRPICRYPAAAVYKGSGDAALAANFTCQGS